MPLDEDKSTMAFAHAHRNGLRAAYHLNRDTPAVELANPRGSRYVRLPTPNATGIKAKTHLLGSSIGEHDVVGSTPRENYSHGGRGQMVMGLPSRGLENYQTLDYHGNVLDQDRKKEFSSDHYSTYAPQTSQWHEDVWEKHGETKMLPSTTILHTLQPSYDTGSHDRITGTLKKAEPAAHVLIKNGVPELLDGHHRTAEWRGRGNTEFPARVLNLDQLGKPVQREFNRANSRKNPEWIR
jgi:hypothetical protein